MKLSAEQFADLAASFSGYDDQKDKRERRRAARLDLRAQATVRMIGGGAIAAPTTVTVNNFSPRGLGLVLRDPLSAGAQFVTQLPRKSGGSVSFLCTVVHSRNISGGLHQIGVEFTCVLRNPAVASPVEQIADELQRIRSSVLD